ncbi:MAG: InlB B-repeat-containing protein [Clostridia bacterium]|nr:InlB B-repeat-containing protein [Clostridia bacterium]
MTKALKKITCIACAVFATTLAFSFAACGDDNDDDNDVTETVKYTVSFETNGGSEIASQEVEEGGYATQPDDPEKSDYIFNGWYTTSDLSTSFEFESVTITADTTVYAGWVSASESTAATATFYWNYDGAPDNGVYYTKEYVSGGKLTKPSNPTRSGYTFEGWYMDADYTTAFVNNSVYTGDVSVYARWMQTYTFEAEDTQLTGLDHSLDGTGTNANGDKLGVGFSSNYSGIGLIGYDSNASNGMAVHGLYYEGAYLEFTIYSDKAETGATLTLRLAAEYREVTLTSSTFEVSVNGTALTYKTGDIVMDGSSYMDGAWGATASSGTPHEYSDYVINSIDLVAGENTILLYVNNSNAASVGTIGAMAPIIDCIKVNSSSTLTMTKYNNY